jgi:hypothetical protein
MGGHAGRKHGAHFAQRKRSGEREEVAQLGSRWGGRPE